MSFDFIHVHHWTEFVLENVFNWKKNMEPLNNYPPPHRSLCVDALIELSDENADWKLSFDEFLNCLKPGFNPPEKSEPKAFILWMFNNSGYSLI